MALMRLLLGTIVCCGAAFFVASAPVARAADQTAACTSTVGPGIPPPSSLPSGLPGFHAAWYGQSGYPTLCPGERSTATVAYYNSGSQGWVRGRMGEMAFLGTSDPIPGRDQTSQLGGSGGASPNTGWPSNNRVAAQPADYVGPGQVAWFQFTIQAPATPGIYRLYIRPLIEGATWMEDQGVFWQVTVQDADAVGSIAVPPSTAEAVDVGATRTYSATVSGSGCVDLAFVDDVSYPVTSAGGLADGDANGTADLSAAAAFPLVNGAPRGTSYVDCVTPSMDQTVTFVVTSTIPNANLRPIVFRDGNNNNAVDLGAGSVPSEPWGLGGPVLFLPPEAVTGAHTATAFAVSTAENYLTDTAAAATYRYDGNDTFHRSGVSLGVERFEQLISRGDTLSISYAAEESGTSTFTITNDIGREAPAAEAVLDSWDGGATQNDVGLLITELPTNVDGIAYSIQRSTTGGVAVCSPGTGAYTERTLVVIPSGSNATTFVDRDLGVGAYCYRVGATDPVTGIGAFGYSQGVTINNPPLPKAVPRSLDARVTTIGGSPALLDTGDVIKIAFSKEMRSPIGSQLRVQDADGTMADLRCQQGEQACILNAGPETLGGTAHPTNTLLTITIRTAPIVVTAGASVGLQLNVTVISGNFLDVAGNSWDISGSDDAILGAPD